MDKIWKPHKRQETFFSLPDTIFEALYGGAAGGGKDFSLETLVPVHNGYKALNDIHPGDLVFSELGELVQVLAESEVFTNNLCYKLTFDDKTEVVCGSDHLWKTFNVKDRDKQLRRTDEYREKRRALRPSRSKNYLIGGLGSGKGNHSHPDLAVMNSLRDYDYLDSSDLGSVKTTQEIYDTLKVRGTRINHSIPLCLPWELPEKNLPIDPYVLGIWLGDGSHSDNRLTSIDEDIWYNIKMRGFEVSHHTKESSHCITGLTKYLRESNLINNKHIPHDYLFSSYKQRLDLLRGLMDTDGSCLEDGQCEFSQLRDNIAEGVYHLAVSLGLKPFWGKKYSASGNLHNYIKWTSTLHVFSLQRKTDRLPETARTTQKQRYIVNCEPVESVPTKCIKVDNPTGLFLISKSGIPTHNSEALLMLPIVRGFYKEPRFKGLLLRRTFPELESEIIIRSREWYPLTGAKYNEERKRWTFPSGAVMQFGHTEYEEDVRKYDTAEYNYVAYDELTSFTEFQYTYISKTRCRSSSSRLPAIVRSATNPGNIGHAWVRDLFIKPAPYGTIIVDKRTKIKRIFIQSLAEDNPYLMANDPGYVNRLEGLDEAEKQAKRYGHWDSFAGQVFDEYREIPNEAKNEPENANHIVQPFNIPDYWLRFLAIDWGYSAMTVALWGALSPKDRLFVYREYAIKEAKTSTWATDIGRLSQGETYSDVVLCRSAWQNRGEQLNQSEQFTKYSGLTARMADNDRIAGKLLIQEYLRWREKPKSKVIKDSFDNDLAARILRLQGIEKYKSYLASFEPEKVEADLPRLQIFPDCIELRKCLPLCIYDKKSNTTNKPAEDVREFSGDDPYDTLRYLISSVDKYLGSLKQEGDHRDRVSEILEKFEKNKDYNFLYRSMEIVERNEPELVPVRRYHRARDY